MIIKYVDLLSEKISEGTDQREKHISAFCNLIGIAVSASIEKLDHRMRAAQNWFLQTCGFLLTWKTSNVDPGVQDSWFQ